MVVKGSRPNLRQRQATATREQIATAARTLFAAHGYVATTIAAIADAADVAVPTVYKAFGTKRRILDEVFESWIRGARTQELLADALTTADPADRLCAAAHWQRREFESGLDVIMIYREAARTDPAMAAEFRDVLARRERGLLPLIASLEGDLAPGLDAAEAMDRFVACTLAETYRTVVHDRGWTPLRYEGWLADLLVAQLLSGGT